jgi:uncharacterized membrane protein
VSASTIAHTLALKTFCYKVIVLVFILLMVISGYFRLNYHRLLMATSGYWRLLMAIILVAISAY